VRRPKCKRATVAAGLTTRGCKAPRDKLAMTHKEEMIMKGQILVPINSHLQVRDIFSVIEKAAKPGMIIVFLIRYPVDLWEWLRDHWVTSESSRNAMLAGREIMDRYSLAGQRALAEEIVAPWSYALQKIGVKATVEVYTGSLSSAVENHSRGDGISLVIPAQDGLPMMGFLHRPIAFILKTATKMIDGGRNMRLKTRRA
jgi:hypothetical protein